MGPKRVQRKRSKGFRLSPDTVCVNRPTRWGNPFVVGEFGTQRECVEAFDNLCSGYICFSGRVSVHEQKKSMSYILNNINMLRGKNIACFCKEGTPCHGDILLRLANG